MITSNITLNNINYLIKSFIPKLLSSLYKGQMGRIGIIGGSYDYTGAPYYSAQSTLYLGSDLVTIFTSYEALIPIKSYSPELMVTSFYNLNEIERIEDDKIIENMIYKKLKEYLNKLHVIVIGPGLGRHPKVLKNLEYSINYIKYLNIPLVFDADGLYMVSQNLNLVYGNKRCVLTPNINEFRMLINRAIEDISWTLQANLDIESDREKLLTLWCKELHNSERGHILLQQLSTNSLPQQLKSLCICLAGVTILLKGENDMICGSLSLSDSSSLTSNNESLCSTWDENSVSDVFILHSNEISPRRCGGQGDILAGCVGAAIHWTTSLHPSSTKTNSLVPLHRFDKELIKGNRLEELLLEEVSPFIQACILGSVVTKKASYLAYQKKRRATTSPDIMEEIGKALEIIIDE